MIAFWSRFFFLNFRTRLGFKAMADPLVYVLYHLCAKDSFAETTSMAANLFNHLLFQEVVKNKGSSELDESKSIGISSLTKFVGLRRWKNIVSPLMVPSSPKGVFTPTETKTDTETKTKINKGTEPIKWVWSPLTLSYCICLGLCLGVVWTPPHNSIRPILYRSRLCLFSVWTHSKASSGVTSWLCDTDYAPGSWRGSKAKGISKIVVRTALTSWVYSL